MSRRLLPALAVILAIALSGCLAWTEDQAGKLTSIGLPGLPVWTAKDANAPRRSRAGVPTSLRAAELEANGDSSAPWLAELNKWREMSGAGPVGANSELSEGSYQHARYLVEQASANPALFEAYVRGAGAAVHTENPASPYFTDAGYAAAHGGPSMRGVMQSADVAFAGPDARRDILDLLVAPFHRMSLLAPWARVAGYGTYGIYPHNAAAIALRGPESYVGGTEIYFPPEGSTVPLTEMKLPEWPNPLGGCPGYELPVGLPVTLQLGANGAAEVAAYSFRDTTTGERLQSCAFDAGTYNDPDPSTQSDGREVLKSYGALILIPRRPLQENHSYEVSIGARGREYRWSFSVGGQKPAAVQRTRADMK